MFRFGGRLRPVLAGPLIGLAAQALLLGVLAATVGLGAAGWIAGAACGLTLDAALAHGLFHDRSERLGPAGWVTLARASLAVGVAALTADSFVRDVSVPALVALAAVALALDLVDGRVARRTGTTSRLGARMDGEVDAFLILALSLYVAPTAGWWVLAIGAARYAFLAAGWLVAWMRAPLPRRDWRKIVAATQGVVLTVAAAGVLPLAVTQLVLAGALALLAESFGRDVWWLWRHRHAPRAAAAAAWVIDDGEDDSIRSGLATVLTILALLLVWVAFVAPNEPSELELPAFVRVPLEGLILVAVLLALPRTPRCILAWLVGPVLGALLLVKVLDIGFFTAFDRPFSPVDDYTYADIGVETLREAVGQPTADVVVVLAALLGLAVLALPTLALLRLTRVAAGRRRTSLQVLAALAAVWAVCWLLGAQLVTGAPVASTSAAELAVDEVQAVQVGLRDREQFAIDIRRDSFRQTAPDRLLTDLRGKDVLLVFIESYGRIALEGSSFAPGVDAVLDRGDQQLADAGFSARSGWLTSPTFGGISWLAHSTMHSGVWVNSQARYDELVQTGRFTLSQAFQRAGWRAIDVVPSNNRTWAEGTSFYHYDRVYDRRNVGYRGPKYAYASMPDQFVLEALQRLELSRPDRRPLFAELDLVSSHTPWTKIPPLIDWDQLGDGSIFHRLPVDESGLGDRKEAYGRSIEYTLQAIFGFVQRYGTDDTVLVVLGDHQPNTTVTGDDDPSHDVPISIIARDPKVLQQIDDWHWVDGVRPGPSAPVWPMSSFRNRFLGAFGP